MRRYIGVFEFCQLLQQFALTSGEFLRHFDVSLHVKIALAAPSAWIGQSLAANPENFARFGASGDLQLVRAIERGNLNRRTAPTG